MSNKGKTTQADNTEQTDDTNDDNSVHDSQMTTGDEMLNSSQMTDNNNLIYDWEHCETLQIVRAFTISDYGTKSDDGQTTDDEFMVPDPSISGIIDSTISVPPRRTISDVEEKYVVDDMSSFTNFSNIKVSNAPQKHEYGKERVARKGNIYDKLYNAALKGQLSIVRDILEDHNTAFVPDESGQTPMYAACIGNHPDIISLLINSEYDVNQQDNEGKTPLHTAFENHVPDLAQILIARFGTSIGIRDKQNWTPLHTAIDRGYSSYSKELLEKFLLKDAGTGVGWIQLHAACLEENIQNVQLLLDANTDVNHVSSS